MAERRLTLNNNTTFRLVTRDVPTVDITVENLAKQYAWSVRTGNELFNSPPMKLRHYLTKVY